MILRHIFYRDMVNKINIGFDVMSLGNDDFGFYSPANEQADVGTDVGTDLPEEFALDNKVFFPVHQCISGGWETETESGRVLETDTTVHYNVVLEFEDSDAQKAFLERDDAPEIVNTMDATVRSMTQDTLSLEIPRDYEPGAYADGVVPEDPTLSLSDNTLNELNEYDMQDFTRIMQETYPDIGLVGATVDGESATQLPGCYQGIEGDIGQAAPTESLDADIAQAPAFTGMKI